VRYLQYRHLTGANYMLQVFSPATTYEKTCGFKVLPKKFRVWG